MHKNIAVAFTSTILYWLWETQAQGNIRVDLLLIYPVLFFTYLKCFWNHWRFYSIPISIIIMMINFGFFGFSYQLFDKHPGRVSTR